jgi:hypothetical protein
MTAARLPVATPFPRAWGTSLYPIPLPADVSKDAS